MIKPDLITVWPDVLDYPLFRSWVHEHRERFSKVIIVFTKTNWGFTDMRTFIRKAMKDDAVLFLESNPVEDGDWRNIAVNQALTYSDNEWIFFTEQDFFPQPDLWNEIQTLNSDIIGVMQGSRLHPCAIFMKRDVLDKTSLDFSAHPPEYDHFGKLQKELMNWDPPLVESIINPKFYRHMNGLSHNMFLLLSEKEITYKPEEFKEYLHLCLQIPLPLHPELILKAKEYLV